MQAPLCHAATSVPTTVTPSPRQPATHKSHHTATPTWRASPALPPHAVTPAPWPPQLCHSTTMPACPAQAPRCHQPAVTQPEHSRQAPHRDPVPATHCCYHHHDSNPATTTAY